MLSFNIEN